MNSYQNIIDNLAKNNEIDEELVKSTNDPKLLCKIGMHFKNLKKYNDAIKYFNMAHALDPNNVSSMFNLGYCYARVKNHMASIKYYKMVLRIEPKCKNSLNNVGAYYKNIENNIDEAIKYYILSSELGNVHAANNLANIYADKKKYELAKQYWSKAIDLGSVKAIKKLAEHYDSVEKNSDLSNRYYIELIDKNNDTFSYSVMTTIIFKVAERALEKKNLQEAEKYYSILLDNKCKFRSKIYKTLVCVFAEENDMARANKYFNMMLQDITVAHESLDSCKDQILMLYVACVNNKVSIDSLLSFFKKQHNILDEKVAREHSNKLKLMSSHLNYLLTLKFEKIPDFTNNFSDLKAN